MNPGRNNTYTDPNTILIDSKGRSEVKKGIMTDIMPNIHTSPINAKTLVLFIIQHHY